MGEKEHHENTYYEGLRLPGSAGGPEMEEEEHHEQQPLNAWYEKWYVVLGMGILVTVVILVVMNLTTCIPPPGN